MGNEWDILKIIGLINRYHGKNEFHAFGASGELRSVSHSPHAAQDTIVIGGGGVVVVVVVAVVVVIIIIVIIVIIIIIIIVIIIDNAWPVNGIEVESA